MLNPCIKVSPKLGAEGSKSSGSCGSSRFGFPLLWRRACCGYNCVEAETGYSTYGRIHK